MATIEERRLNLTQQINEAVAKRDEYQGLVDSLREELFSLQKEELADLQKLLHE